MIGGETGENRKGRKVGRRNDSFVPLLFFLFALFAPFAVLPGFSVCQ